MICQSMTRKLVFLSENIFVEEYHQFELVLRLESNLDETLKWILTNIPGHPFKEKVKP